jgi:mannose-1-phosphate guanylyltransferase/mannose-1-phosphate guanylyltransferase/mannose-6-phosphate isomerase
MTLLNPFEIERPWGNFRQFTHNDLSTVKLITVLPNESLSLQNHAKRTEFWHIVAGNGTVEIGGIKKEAQIGGEYEIPIGTKHRLSAGPSGIQVLEIALGDFDEADIVHFEDKYGRI